jgi:DENR, N-terminal
VEVGWGRAVFVCLLSPASVCSGTFALDLVGLLVFFSHFSACFLYAVCGVPCEYCEYGTTFQKCKEWMADNQSELFERFKGRLSRLVSVFLPANQPSVAHR